MLGDFCSVKSRANERLPTRPQYIRKIITYLENVHKSLVMPVDIPTVSIAEKTSIVTSVRSSEGWAAQISSPLNKIRDMFMVITAAALFRASDSRRLFITFISV